MSAAEDTGAPFDLSAFLRAGRDHAERALEAIPLHDIPLSLHAPIDYAVRAGGKRLRPILCAAAWRAASGTDASGAVHRAASALELIHAYSLVHDDLPFMDDDDIRRGRPTTHRTFGTATSTVAGAAMIVVAFRVLADACTELGLGAEARAGAIAALADGAGAAGMVGGQWLDLSAEGKALARPDLERIHALKTGALIRAAVLIGGILADAPAARRAALATYGDAVGLAFQIADDLLDARGDSAALGKNAGRDAELAKSTYPALLGVQGAERLARSQVDRAVRTLEAAGLRTPELESLARFALERAG